MKRKFVFAILVMALLTACTPKAAQPTQTVTVTASPVVTETQQPSSGVEFQEKNIAELNIKVLIPKGWFYKRETHEATEAFFVTKEDIDVLGTFSTGLTVNVVPNVQNVATEAMSFITGVSRQTNTTKVLDSPIKTANKDNTKILYGVSIQDQLPVNKDNPNITVDKTLYYFAIADTQTNTLHVIIFESPTKEWDFEWNEYGAQITNSVITSVFGEQ